jgi:hypothetical protein
MITDKQASGAVARMAALEFFPLEAIPRAEIGRLLMRMVGTPAQLEWLVNAMIDRVGTWKGPRELRAIFCTKYAPIDGIEAWAETPGFTAADSESQSYLEHSHVKELEDDSHKRGPSELKQITQ